MVISMDKCECYEERQVIDYYSLNFDRRLVGICNGTKERDECRCKGNRAKCDFYPEVREKAQRQTQEYRDVKELEFYRWWVKQHDLQFELLKDYEKWLKDENISNT